MSHDPKNPISNETGEYLQELTERQERIDAVLKAYTDAVAEDLKAEDKPKPAKRTRRSN